MAAVDMRYFPAHEGPTVDYCRQRVRECEAYIAVVGFRYGSIVPDADYSYTEAEFREASAAGIPRLVFLLDESALLPEGQADSDRSEVERFRRQLSEAGLILARFAEFRTAWRMRYATRWPSWPGLVHWPSRGWLYGIPCRPAQGRLLAGAPRWSGSLRPRHLRCPTAGWWRSAGCRGGKTPWRSTPRTACGTGSRPAVVHRPARPYPGSGTVSPEAALAGLLYAVGVDPAHAGDLEGRAALAGQDGRAAGCARPGQRGEQRPGRPAAARRRGLPGARRPAVGTWGTCPGGSAVLLDSCQRIRRGHVHQVGAPRRHDQGGVAANGAAGRILAAGGIAAGPRLRKAPVLDTGRSGRGDPGEPAHPYAGEG